MSDEGKKIWPGSYEVGYGKPPVKGRFVKGKSGNPRGRPRKRKKAEVASSNTSARDIFLQMADQKIKILENGEPIEIKIIEAAHRMLGVRAVKGDVKAIRFFIEEYIHHRDNKQSEIENNHQVWRDFIKNFDEIKAKTPEKLKDLPHPEDLIFPPDGLVEVIFGSPQEAEKHWRIMVLARDLFFVWGELDNRRLTGGKPRLIAPMSLFTFFALKVNQLALPNRYQLFEKELNERFEILDWARKVELLNEHKKIVTELGYPDAIVREGPIALPHLIENDVLTPEELLKLKPLMRDKVEKLPRRHAMRSSRN